MFGISFGPKSITVQEAHDALGGEGHILLDVRTEAEVAAVGVPGALNIPLDVLEQRIEELQEYRSIHVLCRSGGRSSVATHLLQGAGLSQTVNVSGGILSWEAADLPVISK